MQYMKGNENYKNKLSSFILCVLKNSKTLHWASFKVVEEKKETTVMHIYVLVTNSRSVIF